MCETVHASVSLIPNPGARRTFGRGSCPSRFHLCSRDLRLSLAARRWKAPRSPTPSLPESRVPSPESRSMIRSSTRSREHARNRHHPSRRPGGHGGAGAADSRAGPGRSPDSREGRRRELRRHPRADGPLSGRAPAAAGRRVRGVRLRRCRRPRPDAARGGTPRAGHHALRRLCRPRDRAGRLRLARSRHLEPQRSRRHPRDLPHRQRRALPHGEREGRRDGARARRGRRRGNRGHATGPAPARHGDWFGVPRQAQRTSQHGHRPRASTTGTATSRPRSRG